MDQADQPFSAAARLQPSHSQIASLFSEWISLGIAADDAAQLCNPDAAREAMERQRVAVTRIATTRANAVCEMLPKIMLLKIAIDGDDGALIGALCLSLAFDCAALS